jgi:single-strand DNA-binding protein
MPDLITLTGVVATSPKHITTNNGLDITSFRLASSQRRFDREQKRWIEVDTNWYTVTGFRQLAQNLATSIRVGQRVVVSGRLRIRAWENAEKSGTTIELEADAVGHDLSWGTSTWVTSLATSGAGGGEEWSADALAGSAGAVEGEARSGHDGAGSDDTSGGGVVTDTSRAAADLVPF